MALDWLPVYPATVAKAVLLTAAFQPYYASNTAIIPAISSWKATYPDRIVRKTLLTAQQRFSFHDIRFAPALLPPTPLTWEPEYPSLSDRRRRPMTEQRLVIQVLPTFVPTTTLREFPEYPDQTERLKTHPARLPFLSLRLEGIPPFLSWKGEQPEQTRPKVGLRAAAQEHYQFYPEPVAEPVTSQPSWEPTYPDRVYPRVTVPASARPSFTANIVPIPNPPPPTNFSSLPVYPAFLSPRPVRPLTGGVVPVPAVTVAVGLVDLISWTIHEPTPIIRATPRPAPALVQPILPVPPVPVAVPPLAVWRPTYPDWLRRVANSNDFFGFDPLSTAVFIPAPPECIEWTEEALFSTTLLAEDITRSTLRNEDVTGPGFLGIKVC